MAEHTLKTLPDYWDAISGGEKNFEVRRDDRGFQKGDVLVLQRLNSLHEIRCEITYILRGGQFGIEPGYVVMGIKKC